MSLDNEFTDEEKKIFAEQGVDPPNDAPIVEGVNDTKQENTQAEGGAPPATTTGAGGAKVAAPTIEPKTVPLEALHEARAKLQESQRNLQLLQTRTNAVLAARKPEGPKPLPDIEKDPKAYVEELARRQQEIETTRAQSDHERQVDNAVEADERAFMAYTPGYEQAMQHYVKSRGAELLIFNSPQEVADIMKQEVRNLAKIAWQRGVPVAESIYKLAQTRGYRPGQQAAPQQQQIPPKNDPAAIVNSVIKGQEASRSLGGGQGSGSQTELSAEQLLKMTDAEFEAHLKLGQRGASERFEAAMGG